ncbi:hypothetical protein [Metabacillus arenae]|uniref:DUF2802 domain-containing protein n=1 Tax=Metabacillus arenae TaxID=2771434 RepID=A0A926N7P9_9BACI|nr:hypothetical protein [Metabacillus arenae]MBD1378892.1 hypothetical protein [Metabacillus arenae]
MEFVIAALFLISIVLIGLSFFQRDSFKELEQDVDTLQLSAMQEIYKLKKKVRVLEEELLPSEVVISNTKSNIDQHTVRQILSKYENGMSVDAIAKAEHVTKEEVNMIIKQNERVLT